MSSSAGVPQFPFFHLSKLVNITRHYETTPPSNPVQAQSQSQSLSQSQPQPQQTQRGSQHHLAISSPTPTSTPSAALTSPVLLTAVTAGVHTSAPETPQFSFTITAAVCSNAHLLLRFDGNSSPPLLRIVPWHRDNASKRLTSLTFHPNAEWLMLVCADSTLYLMDVREIWKGKKGAVDPYIFTNRNGRIEGTGIQSDIPSLASVMSEERKAIDDLAILRSYRASVAAVPLSTDPSTLPPNVAPPINPSLVPFGPNSAFDLVEIKPGKSSNVNDDSIVCSLWWHSLTGEDYAILVSLDSTSMTSSLILVNCRTQERNIVKVKSNIGKLEMMNYDDYRNEYSNKGKSADFASTDTRQQWQMLLLTAVDGKVYTMLLEDRIKLLSPTSTSHSSAPVIASPHEYDVCINNLTSRRFKPVHLKRFTQGNRISVQYIHNRAHLSVYDTSTQLLDVYSVENIIESGGKPFATYTVPNARYHLIANNFIFCVSVGREETSITIVSTHLSTKSFNPFLADNLFTSTSPTLSSPLLQSLSLSTKLFGLFSLIPMHFSFLLWSRQTVFVCEWKKSSDSIFFQLLEEKKDTLCMQILDMSIGYTAINRYSLFKNGGDRAIERREYERAIELYNVSNVGFLYIVAKLIGKGQMALVMRILKEAIGTAVIGKDTNSIMNNSTGTSIHFASMLRQGARSSLPSPSLLLKHQPSTAFASSFASSPVSSRHLDPPLSVTSNLLLTCYIDALSRTRQPTIHDYDDAVDNSPPSALTADFLDFLHTNKEYSTTKALVSLLDYFVCRSGIHFLLRLAHERKSMEKCLDFIAVYGAHHITAKDVGFLAAREYSTLLLKSASGSCVFRCLPYWQQLEIVIVEMMPAALATITSFGGKATLSGLSSKGSNTSNDGSNSDTSLFLSLTSLLLSLLPHLDSHDLIRLCTFTDPASRALPYNQLESWCRVQVMEVFISAMLRLRWLNEREERKKEEKEWAEKSHKQKKEDKKKSSSINEEKINPEEEAEEEVDEEEEVNFYSQTTLLSRLHSHSTDYRIWLILARSVDCENYLAVSLLFELSEQWSDAMEAKLKWLDQQWDRKHRKERILAENTARNPGDTTNASEDNTINSNSTNRRSISNTTTALKKVTELDELAQQAFDLLFSYCPKIPAGPERTRMLALLLDHWRSHSLPSHIIEQALIENLSGYADSLCAIAFPFFPLSQAITHLTNPISLSPTMYLHLTYHRVRLQGNSNPSIGNNSRLWSEILTNMHDEIEKRSALFINQAIPVANSSAIHLNNPSNPTTNATKNLRESRADDDHLVAFTCGHTYTCADLRDHLLPTLTSRLASHSPPIPITIHMLLLEYERPLMRVACPLCLIATLQGEQAKMQKAAEQAMEGNWGGGVTATWPATTGTSTGTASRAGSASGSTTSSTDATPLSSPLHAHPLISRHTSITSTTSTSNSNNSVANASHLPANIISATNSAAGTLTSSGGSRGHRFWV